MTGVSTKSGGKLQDLAQELLSKAEQYENQDRDAGAAIVQVAEEIIRKIGKPPEQQMLEDSVKAGEMVAKHLFSVWGVFEKIPDNGSIRLQTLAEAIDCEIELLRRYARMLVATGVLQQLDGDEVAHTEKSRIFINDNPSGALSQVMFVQGLVPFGKLSEYFKWYGLKEPKGPSRNPLTFASGDPEKFIWEVAYANPEQQKIFMRGQAAVPLFYPATGEYDFSWVSEAAKASDPDRVVFVDVGGSNGHAVRAISAATGPPLTLDRCVLQDMKAILDDVAQSNDIGGLTLMPTDIHKEQPVKGALIYYLRHVLHDYDDEISVTILKVIVEAMADDSKLLIAEQILSDPPRPESTAIDLIMLNIGGKERTRQMFETLMDRAGLEITGVHSARGSQHGVLECVKRG